MFTIGIAEPVATPWVPLTRHTIVWHGAPHETSIGIEPTHPLVGVIEKIEASFDSVGSWVVARIDPPNHEMKRAHILAKKHGWVSSSSIRHFFARSDITPAQRFAYGGRIIDIRDVLVLGTRGFLDIDSFDDPPPIWRSTLTESLVLRKGPVMELSRGGRAALCIGRAHSTRALGMTLLGLVSDIDPTAFVEHELLLRTYHGADAEQAW